MSDWSMYEIEDISWDDLDKNGDHIVPLRGSHQAPEIIRQCDFHKTLRHDLVNDAARETDSKGTVFRDVFRKGKTAFHSSLDDGLSSVLEGSSCASENIIPASVDSVCVNDVKILALKSQDTQASDYCFKGPNTDTPSNGVWSNGPIPGHGDTATSGSLCHFSLDDFSHEENDLNFLENKREDEENDLLEYGWPDIGNFDDIDRLFRYSDSTFGQGCLNNAGDSWLLSSCQSMEASGSVHDPGLRSYLEYDKDQAPNPPVNVDRGGTIKSSDLSSLNDKNTEMECQGTDMGLQARFLGKEQKVPSDGNGNDQTLEYVGNTSHGYGSMQQLAEPEVITASASHVYSSQLVSQQDQFGGPDSFSYQQPPYNQLDYGNHPHHVAVNHSSDEKSENNIPNSYGPSQASNHFQPIKRSSDLISKSPMRMTEGKAENLWRKQQIHVPFSTEHHEYNGQHSQLLDQAPVQKKLHIISKEVGIGLEDVNFDLPALEMESSIVQENSCMVSISSDVTSLESTSFRQLQDVVDQMDVRTKLCIRDSLYRLARSAEQRHNLENSNPEDARRNLAIEELSKSSGYVDVETDTNPIDRSIAYLLFYRASEKSIKPSNDALSLESHILAHGSHHHPVDDS
ncbi:hypothetical protein QJS04_geneDACA022503 [Acorus gramineus]|uniref:Protein LNK1 n=1 Tax=Acorus gramineus TaxID=55184 RepID=A0AAV9A265_ACOGR|nr:hypothetical protein QJS04_geneDACA022503 [Acorus gramineus]